MPYLLFYDCQALDEAVPSDRPVPTTLARVKAMLTKVLVNEGDFVGIVDGEGNVLQLLKEHSAIWMEVPDRDAGGSYGKHVTLEEARDTLDQLEETIQHYLIVGLTFEAWE